MADSLTEFFSSSPEETAALGEKIAKKLQAGSVIALRGGLGSGKTCFAKGIARGLNIKKNVTSPTYTIVSEYEGRLPLYHIDVYRLAGDDDFAEIGGPEIVCGSGVSVIEWSERIPRSLPENAITVSIEITGSENRKISISSPRTASSPRTVYSPKAAL